MTLYEYLNERHCAYKVTEHKPVYTAEQLATIEHVPGRNVAKPVVIRADGSYYVCVLPADRKIDLFALQKHLKSGNVCLASETEMKELFTDAELGAEPPFGNLYNLPTIMDKKLSKDKEIVFQDGSHERAVWMTMRQYRKLAEPTICAFSYPAAFDEIESMPFDPFFYDPYGI
ncbi:MAG: aminoacyl-tRNA deacylase [Planctomycetota bacterium]|jgi:Ala-tRNA(Pro) deacylase